MATTIACPDYPFVCQGGSFEANAWRTLLVSGLTTMSGAAQVWSGVLAGGGGLNVTAPGGMSVQAGTGYCVVASSTGSTSGGYITGIYTTGTLTVATSDPTNPRVDLVCVTVMDDGTSASNSFIQIITGTPASSPSAPALPNSTPNSSMPLFTVRVPAGATSVVSGDLTDVRPWTAANGGVIPVNSVTGTVPSGHTGMIIFDRATNRMWHNPAAGPAQMQVLPWAPAQASTTSPAGSVTNPIQLLSVSFTSSGGDIRITFKCGGIYANAGSGNFEGTFRVNIDGTQVDAAYSWSPYADGNNRGPVFIEHCTSSTLGDTPSAAAHAVTATLLPNYDGTHDVFAFAASYSPMILRVEPVSL